MADREFAEGRSSQGRGGPRSQSQYKKKPRKSFGGFRRKRPPATLTFDYKKVHDLAGFITEEGKINPARVSGLSAQQQRQLTTAVKRARNLAFLSAVGRNTIH